MENSVNQTQFETLSHTNVQLIGLDLGGTKLLAGSTSHQGSLGEERLLSSDTSSPTSIIDQITSCVEDLRDDRPNVSVALGVPAAVDPKTGALDLSPNVPFAANGSLEAHLSQRLGMKVCVENDVNLAALAEARLGAGAKADLVSFISFGTGVGVGIIAQGRIQTGAHGRAGEIAYLPMATSDAGAAGHKRITQFESLVDTAAIRRRYGKDNPDVRMIFERANAGDKEAANVVAQTAMIAARGLATLQTMLDPDVIIVGGGIGTQERFFSTLKAEAEALLPFPLKVEQAKLGPSAGMLGALVRAGDASGLALGNLDIGGQ